MSFCKYKNIFGEPGTGVHSYRVFDVAIVDVLFTLPLARALQLFFFPKDYSYLFVLLFTFLLGIFLHRLFCVKTTVGKFLFGDDDK